MVSPHFSEWCLTIQNDLEELGLEENFDDIKNMSKKSWLTKVKAAMKVKAFEDLLDTQESYSKGESLSYGDLKLRSYFKSKRLYPSQATLIFKIRTRMLNVKNNYRQSYQDLRCPLCMSECDTQEHMMTNCDMLPNKITENQMKIFFGQNEDKMAHIIEKVEANELERQKILDTQLCGKSQTRRTFIECH